MAQILARGSDAHQTNGKVVGFRQSAIEVLLARTLPDCWRNLGGCGTDGAGVCSAWSAAVKSKPHLNTHGDGSCLSAVVCAAAGDLANFFSGHLNAPAAPPLTACVLFCLVTCGMEAGALDPFLPIKANRTTPTTRYTLCAWLYLTVTLPPLAFSGIPVLDYFIAPGHITGQTVIIEYTLMRGNTGCGGAAGSLEMAIWAACLAGATAKVIVRSRKLSCQPWLTIKVLNMSTNVHSVYL